MKKLQTELLDAVAAAGFSDAACYGDMQGVPLPPLPGIGPSVVQ